jgi:alkanesulfonate monooxygenase SsuD/methylene tetrahydromethanopterin reductase-like flavin-dependent oxidoreductase (luciferase family)
MHYGLDIPTTGEYADARVLAQLAVEAEAAGWDGFFLWDVMANSQPVIDPWIALTAIALATQRIRIGTMVLPLARHRPWLVAQRLANLDHLSGGRVVCTVGLGYRAEDFSAYGEESSPRVRAAKLDEGLAILAGLWAHNSFSYTGEHYTLHDAAINPRPLQQPRIPIWAAGGWPHRAPFRRAAAWDGASLKSVHAEERRWLTLEEFAECAAYLRSQRTQAGPFDIVMSGELPDDRAEAVDKMQALAAAGATWWVEEGLGWSLEEFRARVVAGPPGV